MSSRPLVVYGAGGHGKVVADVGRSAGHLLVAFIDDDPRRLGTHPWDIPVLSPDCLETPALAGNAIGLGIGDNSARQRCVAALHAVRLSPATLIHSRAAVAPTARLGTGTVVMALAAVNPDAHVGHACIINTGAVVEHDCALGDFVHLSPNSAIAGGVRIGDRTLVGLGAMILPGVTVGSDVRVGAGAAVVADVPDGETVIGVPARSVLRLDRGRPPIPPQAQT